MRYGFVLDQRKCIGCHACTVACKSENEVPLGSFRTWVKYVEKGTFPNTRRHFAVLRCNHCDDAPCIEICPTRALFKRADGIVDFASERCIGCKSCMQACPYDAIYIDPNTHTAAKCHYCAHRVEVGLEPACVVVCPVQAIIPGDLDDPDSAIAQLVSRETVRVRRPEQGTKPKVFYVGADEVTLTPGAVKQPSTYMWAEVGPHDADLEPKGAPAHMDMALNIGPLAPAMTVYDVAHPKPWDWLIGAYLCTKAIAAGALIVAALALALGMGGGPASALLNVVAPGLGLAFIAITGALLIGDLKRPERFWRVLFTPNWTSWLVWGSYIIVVFTIVGLMWLVGGLIGSQIPPLLFVLGALLGAATAGYSAFLFGQAEGRDFWQSPLLLWQLLAHAVVGGAAALLVGATIMGIAELPTFNQARQALVWTLVGGLAVAFFFLLSELYTLHANDHVAAAADILKKGPLALRFWVLVVGLGTVVPLVLLAFTSNVAVVVALASVLALVGIWVYEDLWVRAGQSVPIS
ncbi:MAG: polysulfide reductase NrfD [Chloroflexi bacterium]|nr:polysulfide reductase NrfD [Chloroflexota bacterium]